MCLFITLADQKYKHKNERTKKQTNEHTNKTKNLQQNAKQIFFHDKALFKGFQHSIARFSVQRLTYLRFLVERQY